jgi:hypothetical protein
MKKPENSGLKKVWPPCCESTQASQIVAHTSTMGLRTGRLNRNITAPCDKLSRRSANEKCKKDNM